MRSANSCIAITGIYRPHSSSVEDFIPHIDSVLSSELLQNKISVINGDFNVNILLDNHNSDILMGSFQSCHYLPKIMKPTRLPYVETQSSSLLDLIFINSQSFSRSGIILNDLTDHMPTYIIIPFSVRNSKTEMTKIYFRDHSSHAQFEENLAIFDWSSIRSNDVGASTTKFI